MCAVVQKHWYQQERIRLKHSVTLIYVDCILWITQVLLQSLGRTPRDLIPLPPLFMCHGDRDTLIPHEWGQYTFNRLKQLGVHGEFHTLHNSLHEMKEKELQQLYSWINRRLPPPM
jgi:acetyl esterase/lipase